MQCSGCGRNNPPENAFCGSCGSPLASAPASRPTARSYTPRHLVDRILTSRSAMEGERKQVTVLFADVKGSMELAEQIDAEQWHGILDRFFTILSEGVHRFEGTVNQYRGDGIMALFGAPVAHEDHAQRACHAALHLAQRLRSYADELRLERGLNFSVRMGRICRTLHDRPHPRVTGNFQALRQNPRSVGKTGKIVWRKSARGGGAGRGQGESLRGRG